MFQGSVVQHKLVKERPSSSLTPTALGHQMVDVDDTSNDSDMLQNLLGVENSAIDQMLNSADSAAHLLGFDWHALYWTHTELGQTAKSVATDMPST